MSFSKDTKNELCGAEISSDPCRHSLAYGMVLFSKVFTPSTLSFTTECRPAALFYSNTLSSLTSAIVDITVTLTRKGKEKSLFTLSVPDTEDCGRIFDYFGHVRTAPSLRINRSNIEDEDSLACFWK